jgi:serine/threonine protein kinase
LRHIHEVHDPDDRFPQCLFGRHHDLKPENILVFQSGRAKISDFRAGALGERTEILKIADFGSAHIRNEESKMSLFSKRVYSGTLVYDGPEVESQELVSQPADMWSLGCILLEILAWSVRPPGYSPLDFHYSRVMTLKTEDDESGERLAQLNAPFWSKDNGRENNCPPCGSEPFATNQWTFARRELASR